MGLEAFGTDVAEKVKEATKTVRVKRLNMTQQVRDEIIQQMKEQLKAKPEQPQTNYVKEEYGRIATYDIMLVQTYDPIEIRPTRYNPYVMVKWRGERMSAFMDANLAESLTPSTDYIFAGRYSLNQGRGRYQGRTFNNFSVHGVITMGEVEQHGKEQKTQDEEIQEKISDHQEKPEPASIEDKLPIEKEPEVFEEE